MLVYSLYFEHVSTVFCKLRPPTFVLESLLSLIKIALIENRFFFKTLPRSINARFMLKGGVQGVL